MMVHRLVCDFNAIQTQNSIPLNEIQIFHIFLEEDLSFENYEQDDTSNDHFITLESFEKGNFLFKTFWRYTFFVPLGLEFSLFFSHFSFLRSMQL